MKPLGYNDAGIVFRHSNDGGEFVYLRANPDCPAADDCIQYAPVNHGIMDWNIYPDEQGPAPITSVGWNHVRLEVNGDRMLVYVNHASDPSLAVRRLQGLTSEGGIALKGPTIYANLLIDPTPPALPNTLENPPPDPGTVTHWLAAKPVVSAVDRRLTAGEIPPTGAWQPIAAERTGLVNLDRAFGEPAAPATEIAWLKTSVTATAAARRIMLVGWTQ